MAQPKATATLGAAIAAGELVAGLSGKTLPTPAIVLGLVFSVGLFLHAIVHSRWVHQAKGIVKGTRIVLAVLVLAIYGVALGRWMWPPTVSITPEEVQFSLPPSGNAGQQHTFTVSNHLDVALYSVAVKFRLGTVHPSAFVVEAEQKPLGKGEDINAIWRSSDVMIVDCVVPQDTFRLYVVFSRLGPGETREIKLREPLPAEARIEASIPRFSKESKETWYERGDANVKFGMWLKLDETCRPIGGRLPSDGIWKKGVPKQP